MSKKIITHNLRVLRLRNKLTQEDVGNLIGIQKESYRAYEEGRAYPDIFNLHTLSKYYGYKMESLITRMFKPKHIDL